MTGRFLRYPDFVAHLVERHASAPLQIGIDGAGGSGKSTLARQLAIQLGAFAAGAGASHPRGAALVHVDDFYQPSTKRFHGPVGERPIGADFDLYITRENPRRRATFVCDGARGGVDEGVWLLDGRD